MPAAVEQMKDKLPNRMLHFLLQYVCELIIFTAGLGGNGHESTNNSIIGNFFRRRLGLLEQALNIEHHIRVTRSLMQAQGHHMPPAAFSGSSSSIPTTPTPIAPAPVHKAAVTPRTSSHPAYQKHSSSVSVTPITHSVTIAPKPVGVAAPFSYIPSTGKFAASPPVRPPTAPIPHSPVSSPITVPHGLTPVSGPVSVIPSPSPVHGPIPIPAAVPIVVASPAPSPSAVSPSPLHPSHIHPSTYPTTTAIPSQYPLAPPPPSSNPPPPLTSHPTAPPLASPTHTPTAVPSPSPSSPAPAPSPSPSPSTTMSPPPIVDPRIAFITKFKELYSAVHSIKEQMLTYNSAAPLQESLKNGMHFPKIYKIYVIVILMSRFAHNWSLSNGNRT